MKRILLSLALLFSLFASAQDYDTYLKSANESLESRSYRKARENATKAIELNPQSLEARWIRTRTLMLSSSSMADFENAIGDLNFMVANGGGTAKVYKTLGLAETELASNIFRFKKAKENKGFSDDNSALLKEQKIYFNDAISHYKSAKVAYQKAFEISAEEKENSSYRIKEIDNSIVEVETKIKELK